MTRHTLAQEYVLFASRYQPGYAEVKQAAYNSLRYAFLLRWADKARLSRDLDTRFQRLRSGHRRAQRAARRPPQVSFLPPGGPGGRLRPLPQRNRSHKCHK
ncbi:hypothetical protein LP420_11540 [Massilia sp. B-10]|nr:hypothetical protein LP420_11540 [Massilia sp. B-10]